MPIQILPNGQWIDTATGQPVAPGTPQQAVSPNGPAPGAQSAAATAYGAPATTTQTPTTVNTQAPVPAAADQTPAPADQAPPQQQAPATDQPQQQQPPQASLDYQSVANQAYQALLQSKGSLDQINQNLQTNADAITKAGGVQQAAITAPELIAQQTQLMTQQYQALQNWSLASDRYTSIANQAISSQQLTPAQVGQIQAQTSTLQQQGTLYGAQSNLITQAQIPTTQAQGQLYGAQAQGVLQGQIPLNQAQAGYYGQAGQLAGAQAQGVLQGQIPAEQAQANLYGAQAQGVLQGQIPLNTAEAQQALGASNLSNAQAINALGLLPGAIGLQGAQGNLYGAQGQQALGQAALSGAQAQNLAAGGLANLSDRVNYIKQVQQQVFGPGGSGNPAEANDLLNQYVNASVGGTTPFGAASALGQLQQQGYGTQIAGTNALQQSQASRAQDLTSLAANTLGTLASMNQWAPRGSTAMAGAFQEILDNLTSRLQSPQFAATPLPQQPALPSFLQSFAGPGAGGGGGTPSAGLPAAPAQPPAAPAAPAPATLSAPAATGAPSAMPSWLTSYLGLGGPGAAINPGGMMLPAYNQGPGAGAPAAGGLFY